MKELYRTWTDRIGDRNTAANIDMKISQYQ